MAGEPLLPRTPVTLLALSLPPRASRPAVIPAAAPHWLSHAGSLKVGPTSCWLQPRRWPERTAWRIALPGYVAHVECFEAGLCFWGSVPDYTLSGLLCRGKLFCLAWRHGLTWEEMRCWAAAPLRRRLKENGGDVWSGHKRGQFKEYQVGALSGLHMKFGKLQAEKFVSGLSRFKRRIVLSTGSKSKHEATFYTRNYDKFDQTWTKAQNNDAFQHNSWHKNGSKSLKSL